MNVNSYISNQYNINTLLNNIDIILHQLHIY